MAWTKVKTAIVATAAILLTTGTATIVTMSVTGFFGQTVPGSRLRVPVGTGTPAIALGRWHGIILASDGSLWSWGEDQNGWHALGLGGLLELKMSLVTSSPTFYEWVLTAPF